MNCIYISGLEMPGGFAERGFVIRGDGRVRTFAGAVYDNAIAIPVPDHGRLIDADALVALFREKAEKNKGVGGLMVNMAAVCIEEAPTIIQASVCMRN